MELGCEFWDKEVKPAVRTVRVPVPVPVPIQRPTFFPFLPSSEFFRRDAELTACHCAPGAEFGWRPQLATFASDSRGSTAHAQGTAGEVTGGEKRRQRDFIKKHTGIKGGRKLKKNGNRFLKNLSSSPRSSSLQSVDPVIASWRRVKLRGYNRSVGSVLSQILLGPASLCGPKGHSLLVVLTSSKLSKATPKHTNKLFSNIYNAKM